MSIDLPDPGEAFAHENAFHLTAPVTRLAKLLAHYEMFRLVAGRPGAIVECGVFKGASFTQLAAFRDLLGDEQSNPLVGFDTFDTFPEGTDDGDHERLTRFLSEAGDASIGVDQLRGVLRGKGVRGEADLVHGDICTTVPAWVVEHPDSEILLLHVDVDLFEPTTVILEHLWPRVVSGGIMILDDYGRWEGETRAVDQYFGDDAPEILRVPFLTSTPVYVIKP